MGVNATDGGPAFPTDNAQGNTKGGVTELLLSAGMSLRDYFAGQALMGVLSAEAHPSAKGAIPTNENLAAFVALHCYRYADAMLTARDVEGRTRDDRERDRQREDESV